MADDFNMVGMGVTIEDDSSFVPLDDLENEEGAPVTEETKTETEKHNDSEAEGGEGKSQPSGQGRQEEEVKKEEGGGTSQTGEGSPTDTPSSIAQALLELHKVGALSTLTEDRLKEVKDVSEVSDVFREYEDKLIEERLTEEQKRLREALGSGMRPDAIQYYEQQVSQLNAYDESRLDDEGEQGEKDRRMFLTWQYKLKQYSDEDIKDLVDKSFDSGNDVRDAKKALAFCRDFFDKGYKNAVSEAKEAQEKQIEKNRKDAEAMRKEVMEGKGYLDDLKVSKATRERIFDYIGKPEHELLGEDGKPVRDAQGRVVKISGLTKYCREHLPEANRLLATILVLTEEGKDFSKLFKGPLTQKEREVNKQLEDALINGTKRNPSGQFSPGLGVSQSVTDDGFVFDE